MVFSSILFLLLFLPVTVALYLVAGQKYRNYLLLGASLLFYAWGEGIYVLIMLASITLNFTFGILIARYHGQRPAVLILCVSIVSNILLLSGFKYTNFLADNLNIVLDAFSMTPLVLGRIHLPIGISFFTFQAMSYVIDVYRNPFLVQRRFSRIALYISLFPQLIAGPIVRYQDIAGQMENRKMDLEDFAIGFRRFVLGMGKKVLIANPLAIRADQVFAVASADLTTGLAWYGICCYTLQIFFDFSGYSDMAIGLGRMFGFRFLENFNYPYIANSIQDFWRRWHISLSTWFRDYLYIPLGGNRKSPHRTYGNLLVVFFLCGLWHGASWTFVIWGLYHGLFLVLERTAFGKWMGKLAAPLRHGYTLLAVVIGWVFFRSETLEKALGYLTAMAGFSTGSGVSHYVALYWDSLTALAGLAGILCSLPIGPWISRFMDRLTAGTVTKGVAVISGSWEAFRTFSVSVVLTLSILQLSVGAYNPFIYFRF